MRFKLFLVALLVISFIPSAARADGPWRIETGLHLAAVIAGGSSVRGGKAPATGGAAFVPTLRVLYQVDIAAPYVAVSPILVAPPPYKLDSLGFVGAVDAGVRWQPPSDAWAVGTGATLAPTYLRFCNGTPQCLKEGVLLYGGEVHGSWSVLRTPTGFSAAIFGAAHVLTGRPVAWTHNSLSDEARQVNHLIGMMSAGGLITF
jgi:hypothetical protein